MKDKIIIAHRGASAYGTDNSLDSFKIARNMGADMVEFDLRKTKDGVFIAYHNPKLKGSVVRETSYNDLKKLSKRNGFQIPTVEEIVETCGEGIGFDVHLKEPGYATEVAGLITKLVGIDKVIITSEHMIALKQLKKEYPPLKLGYIILKENPLRFVQKFFSLRKSPQKILETLQNENIEYVVPDYHFISQKFLEEAKRREVKVLPWTINNPKKMKRYLKENAVHGILTDKPDLAKYL